MMNYYNVEVTVKNILNWAEHKETIRFKSLFAARHMAKKYFECADVIAVEVIDQTTGEIMYAHEVGKDEYDAEG